MGKQFTGYRILLGQKVCKFMMELHSNNHINSVTLNEDTYENRLRRPGSQKMKVMDAIVT